MPICPVESVLSSHRLFTVKIQIQTTRGMVDGIMLINVYLSSGLNIQYSKLALEVQSSTYSRRQITAGLWPTYVAAVARNNPTAWWLGLLFMAVLYGDNPDPPSYFKFIIDMPGLALCHLILYSKFVYVIAINLAKYLLKAVKIHILKRFMLHIFSHFGYMGSTFSIPRSSTLALLSMYRR